MAADNEATTNGKVMDRLAPPDSSHDYSVKEPRKLIIQSLYLAVMFIPLVIWSFLEQFFTKPKPVRGKVVMVTGSARGLGSGFAEKFAKLGCKVACVDLDEELNKETVAALNEKYPGCAKSYRCNVALSTEIAELKQAITKDFGHVNIIIHNAGLIAGTKITNFDDIYVHGVIGVNLTSHFLIYREFLPDMIERNEGHIVAVGSIASFAGMSRASMYCASKHGVAGLMECVYYELNERPNNEVKTSLVCPYFVNTSAFYTKHWNARFPELTIQQTVNAAVHGILRNQRIITIPSFYYYALHLLKFLPDRVTDLIKKIFYIRITIPTMAVQTSTPLYKLLTKSLETTESIFRKPDSNNGLKED